MVPEFPGEGDYVGQETAPGVWRRDVDYLDFRLGLVEGRYWYVLYWANGPQSRESSESENKMVAQKLLERRMGEAGLGMRPQQDVKGVKYEDARRRGNENQRAQNAGGFFAVQYHRHGGYPRRADKGWPVCQGSGASSEAGLKAAERPNRAARNEIGIPSKNGRQCTRAKPLGVAHVVAHHFVSDSVRPVVADGHLLGCILLVGMAVGCTN